MGRLRLVSKETLHPSPRDRMGQIINVQDSSIWDFTNRANLIFVNYFSYPTVSLEQ